MQDAGGNNIFVSNGSGTITSKNSGVSGGMNLISTQTASGSASISFTSGLDSTYDVYIFSMINLQPATDGQYLQFDVSTDGGSTWGLNTMTSFFVAAHSETGSTTFEYTADRDTTNAYPAKITSEMGNGSDEAGAVTFHLFAPSSTTYVKHFYSTSQIYQSSNYSHQDFVGGYVNSTSDVDAIKFYYTSGNIAVGTFKLYGISKS